MRKSFWNNVVLFSSLSVLGVSCAPPTSDAKTYRAQVRYDEFKDLALTEKGTQRLYFFNFQPRGENERLGLNLILGGKVFSPNGVPLQVLERSAAVRPNDGRVPPPKANDPKDQYLVYGNLPSPPSRISGVANGIDLGIAYSLVDLALCKDLRTGDYRMTALPRSGLNPVGDCKTSRWTDRVEVSRTASLNCLGCHTGVVAGVVTAGLANTQVDQVAVGAEMALLKDAIDVNAPDARRRIEGSDGVEVDLPNNTGLRRMLTRIAMGLNLNAVENETLENFFNFSETVTMPVFRSARSRGDNLGPYWVWKYFSRLKIADSDVPTLETYSRKEVSHLDDGLFEKNTLALPPVDANPWWNLRFKEHVYWYGEPNRLAKDFAFNFTQAHRGLDANHKGHVRFVEKALLFARSTISPTYPNTLDWSKVERGASLFHLKKFETTHGPATCSSCHGKYEQRERGTMKWVVDYPGERKAKINFVDPSYANLTQHFGKGVMGNLKELERQYGLAYGARYLENFLPKYEIKYDEVGVISPPLVGLWASAPYFHNGSVPTVYEVLKPQRRAPAWSRSLDPTAYDWEKMGLVYDESEKFDALYKSNRPLPEAAAMRSADYPARAKQAAEHYFRRDSIEFRRTYFTDQFGKGNSGHTFAAQWSDEDVYAVMEFLKSVSGPDVVPLRESPFRTVSEEQD